MHPRVLGTKGASCRRVARVLVFSGLALTGLAAVTPAQADTVTCTGELPKQDLTIAIGGGTSPQPDVLVSGACTISEIGDYFYGNINIVSGGSLTFVEPAEQDPGKPNRTSLWAASIVVENGGSLAAGVGSGVSPYGSNGNILDIILYGAKTDAAATCATPQDANTGPCGVPTAIWNSSTPQSLPGGVTDYFYAYHDMSMHTGGAASPSDKGYFGNKVLAVSYGGSLALHGYKGTTGAAAADADPTATGTSWTRLAADLAPGATSLTVAEAVTGDWAPGDQIAVSTTDYLANHTEAFLVNSVSGTTIGFDNLDPAASGGGALYQHSGTAFDTATALADAPSGFTTANAGSPLLTAGETRAAVGLLSRSIRIVSGGDTAGELFDWEPGQQATYPAGTKTATDKNSSYAYGGHVMFRQGIQSVQLQGVEFRWLGQGGRIGHYPVHFHMARKVPAGTHVKDSAVNESMTRWMVIHRTQGVTLQRNVGFKSIGHGFYLEDATETDNKLYANLGLFARAAVDNKDNPRKVPGILAPAAGNWSASYNSGGNQGLQFASDAVYPTAFWITNGWNDFVGNMAAGAGMCGACYWLLPASPNQLPPTNMSWSGYAQMDVTIAGGSPLKQFYKNYCSTAMHSFMAIGDGSPCFGVQGSSGGNANYVNAIANPDAPAAPDTSYYPNLAELRTTTVCPYDSATGTADCSNTQPCNHLTPDTCAVTYLDTYTSSFNWAETNLGAIWLRGGWNMVDRLFMSDVQNGGVGLISSGDYSRSSAPLGYWSLIAHSVMVGQTQPDNSYAKESGPKDASGKNICTFTGPACTAKDDALSFQLSNWSTNRMLNVYDGPFYQDANAFLDITTSDCTSLDNCMNYTVPGPRRTPGTTIGEQKGYLPNAAIGWKQPNGFYYPPAFHSRNLFFDNVDIRHFLTLPLFDTGTYNGNAADVTAQLINQTSGAIFAGFTDVDRQTVLNDIDGTLTGFEGTISVNEDPYFTAPVQVAECLSEKEILPANACTPKKYEYVPAARTSPYDHLTLAIAPQATDANWATDCTNQNCSGVRLYRQLLTGDSTSREYQKWKQGNCDATTPATDCDWPFIRMAGAAIGQRSVLTANNGTYYIDTSRSSSSQSGEGFSNLSVFEAGKTYYAYFLFAKEDTKQTYQLYVGEGFDLTNDLKFVMISIDQVPFQPNASATQAIPAGWNAQLIKGPGSANPDVLEITVDFSQLPQVGGQDIVLDPGQAPTGSQSASTWGSCQPSSFCAWNGSTCGCALDAKSPFVGQSPSMLATCETVCNDWAVKVLDCPTGGCVGFSFTLPSGFTASDQQRRPQPQPYPSTGPWATTAFQAASQSDAGACYYSAANTPTLGSSSCAPTD
ncbi:hypothetical protein ACFOGJ_13310 [Marinibaculum pumilum]|uniref:G8 domain-containing protein n=1 Tax=Marinibaculum pumilum TaxID=1766165 RepID=A0ABV7L0W0_9PROT